MPREENNLKILRTYKGDLAQMMDTRKESLVSITAAESARRSRDKNFTSVAQSDREELRKSFIKKIWIIAISAILIMLGAGSSFYFYGKTYSGAVETKLKIPSIIFADDEKEFDIANLSSGQILNEIDIIKNSADLTIGRIRNIFIAESFIDENGLERKKFVSSSDFLNLINAQISTSFLRSLSPAFMVGAHIFDGNQPFLIFKTNFYENAFAGMLGWEKNIIDDLFPLFKTPTEETTSAGAVTNTSAFEPTIFSDLVIKNKDARALKSADGKIILLYSFIDKNTIVITTNENTFSEILTRFASSRTLR